MRALAEADVPDDDVLASFDAFMRGPTAEEIADMERMFDGAE
ncbi:hypothetical protein [Candidatus Rariloculus sp.]